MRIYATHNQHQGGIREIDFWNDSRLLNPHKGWAARETSDLADRLGDSHTPIWLDCEQGAVDEQVKAIDRLRGITERRIGVYYRAVDETETYPLHTTLNKAHSLWWGHRLENRTDYATVTLYDRLNDRDMLQASAKFQSGFAGSHLPKPVYGVDMIEIPHRKGVSKWPRWGDARFCSADDLRWRIENIYSLFDGVILLTPTPLPDDLLDVLTEAAT
jgi:hypothetical protein